MAEYIEIAGGRALSGNVKISGAKNAALPQLMATLLTSEKCELENIPNKIKTALIAGMVTAPVVNKDDKDIDIILDGELYIHNEILGNIASAVNKHNINTPRIKFIAFDLAIPDMSNIDRYKLLKHLLDFKLNIIDCNILNLL